MEPLPKNAIHVVVHTEELSQLLYNKLSQKHDIKWVSYRHLPDTGCKRKHFHALLECYTGTRETLRNYIKEIFNVGRGSFFTANTYESPNQKERPIDYGLITYMSKGKLEPEHCVGYSKEFINEWKEKWIDTINREKTIEYTSVEVNYVEKESKKFKKWDYIKMAVTECVEKQAEHESGILPFNEIFEIYKKILINHCQKTGKYKMADDIFTIMLQIDGYGNHMRNQVAKVLGFMDK